MRGLFTPSPPAEMALRLKPSGDASILVMVRSVVGPRAAKEEADSRDRTKERVDAREKDIEEKREGEGRKHSLLLEKHVGK
jgi:hypothetical protein